MGAGYIETTVFDYRIERLLIYRNNIYCKRNVRAFKLEDIKTVRAVQRGFQTR
jgi:hypothetical protein